MYKTLLIALSIVLVSACNIDEIGNDKDNEDTLAGPCVQIEREAIIHLQSATGEISNENIPQIEISEIFYRGTRESFQENYVVMTSNIEIDYENDTLLCTLPCSFLRGEGSYEFTISAAGYDDKVVELDASYSIFDGGCPSYVDGGTKINIRLNEVVNSTTNG